MLERLEKLENTGHEYINVRVWATDKTYFLKRETCFVDSDHMNAEFIYEINGKIVHASLWNINIPPGRKPHKHDQNPRWEPTRNRTKVNSNGDIDPMVGPILLG